MDENQNNISLISLNSFSEEPVTSSTPQKPKKARKPKSKSTTFACPAPVNQYQCPICPRKNYKTLRYYNQHMHLHKVQDTCSKLPDLANLLRNTSVICQRTITRISSVPCFGESGKKFKELLHLVLAAEDCEEWSLFSHNVCEQFASALQLKKFVLPSALWASIFSSLERLLSSRSQRESLEALLSKATGVTDSHTLQLFICEFVLVSSEEVLTFIRESIVPPSNRRVLISFDQDDRQTIHYVGGSIIHHFRKMAKRFSNNKDWQQILTVIETKVIEGVGVEPVNINDKAWTLDVNRGRLVIVGAKCIDVFMSLAALLSTITEPNGTLLIEKVLENVYSSNVPLKWDAMVGQDLLSEDLSLRFMCGVVKSFFQTFGRGLVKKKMNEVNQKPFASVNLRHTVAPKSK